MWSKELAKLQYFEPEVFRGKTPGEEKVCAFILSLAVFANDSKVLVGILLKMIAAVPKFDRVSEELGEYSGQKNYLYRLVYSQLHELHYILMQHLDEVRREPLFQATLKGLSAGSKKSWKELEDMARCKDSPMKIWLKNVRDGLGFHYVRHKELLTGYGQWLESLKPGGKAAYQEGAYISAGKSVKTTRYYFADAAIDGWMAEEMKKFPGGLNSLEPLMERNVIAISGLVNAFLGVRKAKLKNSNYPPLK